MAIQTSARPRLYEQLAVSLNAYAHRITHICQGTVGSIESILIYPLLTQFVIKKVLRNPYFAIQKIEHLHPRICIIVKNPYPGAQHVVGPNARSTFYALAGALGVEFVGNLWRKNMIDDQHDQPVNRIDE